MVTVTFTGKARKVNSDVKRYFKDYHPCGYGTRIRKKTKNADGTITVIVERWYTCD